MVLNEIADRFPEQLYFAVIAASLLYTVWVCVILIRSTIRTAGYKREIADIETVVSRHQGCQIENLPLIKEVFDQSTGRLGAAFDDLMQGAADYYHKRWIPDPASYFDLVKLADRSLNFLVSRSGHIRFLLSGLTLTFASFITAVIFSDSAETIKYAFWLSSLPFILTVISVLGVYLTITSKRKILDDSIDSLNRTIRLKVPVFSENAGVSLLVSQFIEYDRNMASNIVKLTEKIDRFTSDGLVNAVSSSVEDTLREAVFPSIERSNDAILALAKDIASREDEGMKSLALNFASSVTSELSYHLKPVTAQIENLARTLADSKNYIDVISQNINIYKQNASELQALTRQTLSEYEQSRKTFSADVSSIANSLKENSGINREYKTMITEDISKFQSTVESLNSKLNESNATLKVMLDAIFVESRNAEENAVKAQTNAAEYISSMKDQISTLTDELAERNRSLISGLDDTISSFFTKQSDYLESRNSVLADKTESLLSAMESSASAINSSSLQIKAGFDELEEARRRDEEARAKKSFFKRKK